MSLWGGFSAQGKLCRKEEEMPLLRTRYYTPAILAITMVASSAASAAPAPNEIDPYAVLSLLGTAGSSAAACAPGSAVSICPGGSMAAVSAGSAVAASTAATGAAQAPQTYDAAATPEGSMLPLWVGLGAVVATWVVIALTDNNNNNNEVSSPNSPA